MIIEHRDDLLSSTPTRKAQNFIRVWNDRESSKRNKRGIGHFSYKRNQPWLQCIPRFGTLVALEGLISSPHVYHQGRNPWPFISS
jgi:hypothetical protein